MLHAAGNHSSKERFFSDVLLALIRAINTGVFTKHGDCFPGPCNDREVKQVPSHYAPSFSIVSQLKVINFLMSMNPLSVSQLVSSAFINQTDKPYLGGTLGPLL